MYVTARAYPSEVQVRGRRRSGGMAFHVPKFTRDTWRRLVSVLWKGQKVQVLKNGQTLILGYPYLRPSRPRCCLYAIRDALRAAKRWMEDEQQQQELVKEQQEDLSTAKRNTTTTVAKALPSSPQPTSTTTARSYRISIVTDSNSCLDLLGNSTQLLEWGKAETMAEFEQVVLVNPSSSSSSSLSSSTARRRVGYDQWLVWANRDILYPLARTHYQLVHPPNKHKHENDDHCRTSKVQVVFGKQDSLHDLGQAALIAAQLTYESVK